MKKRQILFFICTVLFLAVPDLQAQQISQQNIQVVDRYIQLNLRNKSMQSIPLIIPGVMNPNLSPKSRSGVSLKVGQEIFFKYKGKKRVLLVITDDLKDGDTINVSEVLKEAMELIDGGE